MLNFHKYHHRSGKSVKNITKTNDLKLFVLEEYERAPYGEKEKVLVSLGINKRTFNNWRNIYKEKKAFNLNAGRPPAVESADVLDIAEALQDRAKIGQSSDIVAISNLLQEKVDDRALIRGNCSQLLCTRTIKKYLNSESLKIVKAQKKTKARMVAECDIRNAISTIALFSCINRIVKHRALILNYDSTQFTVKVEKESKNEIVIVERKSEIKSEIPPSTSSYYSHELEFGIKYYSIISAGGYASDKCVFVISDERMDKGISYYLYTHI